jgi:hypothetical protein
MADSNFFSVGFHHFFSFQTEGLHLVIWLFQSTQSTQVPTWVKWQWLRFVDLHFALELNEFFLQHFDLVLEVNSKFPPSDPSLPTHH